MHAIRTELSSMDLPAPLGTLSEIAYNLYWTWMPTAQSLFREIDAKHWQAYQNPVRLLQETDRERLSALATDDAFLARVKSVRKNMLDELSRPNKLGIAESAATENLVAYLCAEFGLHESLPIYSGGLGVLAGDHTKSASDLGLPFIGIGLMYRNGYFRQEIDADGNQQTVFLTHDFAKLPILRVINENGEPLCITVELPGRDVTAQAWHVAVGRSVILLLDTDIDENNEADRKITAQLYGGDREMRIMQEIVLGIGGVRLMRALGLQPAAWHLNEGHVAFSLLERIRELMQNEKYAFEDAMEAVRSTTVFTTHTPVPAGNEAFSIPLLDRYFRHYCKGFGLNVADFIRLGLQLGSHGEKFFSMTVLALRLSCVSNGVSALHGIVSQKMWAHLWPEVPHNENPITSITNGVHTRSWMAPQMADFLDKSLGTHWHHELENRDFWQNFDQSKPDEFRNVQKALKDDLFTLVRERLRAQYQRHGASVETLQSIDNWLNHDALTIGFARRFATYKRALLIFKDMERLQKIVNNPGQPVQLLFAGKAHPADKFGQALIKELWRISQMPEFLGKIVILENYDMRLGRALVQGVDLWLNNPRRPQEASGTSGQKVPINGGINFSVLDGWWPEAYNGENGWKIGREEDYPSDEVQDDEDAFSLYDTLENRIIPLYYGQHDITGKSWEDFAKASLKTTVPVFNTEVMVRNYYNKLYRIAISHAQELAKAPQTATALAASKETFRDNWPLLHFTSVQAHIAPENGETAIQVELYIGELSAGNVVVELYCESKNAEGGTDVQIFALEHAGDDGEAILQRFALKQSIPHQPGTSYKLRVRPHSEALTHPNELGLMYWHELSF